MKSVIIIPARIGSTRLPRKMLLSETGKSLLQHTFEAASRAEKPESVIIATDSAEIQELANQFGAPCQMTDPNAATGTDRVAEVAADLIKDANRPSGLETMIIVNVQGDEPEISGESIDLAVEILEKDPRAMMSTLATPIRNIESLHDPNCVKVVCDADQNALYFSRSPIPYPRDPLSENDKLLSENPASFFQHVGLYAYRLGFLLKLAQLPQTKIEKIERLEQLRVLDAGYRIKVGIIDQPLIGIDTEEDYRAFVKRIENC